MDLSNEIRQCTRCLDLGMISSDRLNTSEKPCVQFNVDKEWKPGRVQVLFVAESPPPNGYFYNQDEKSRSGGLRTEVLNRLQCSLGEFKEKYLMLDTIKCRLNKSKSLKTPLRMARISKNCAALFLRKEIDELKPETIFVLGKIAKEALEQFPEFEELSKHGITDEFDKVLTGYRVILCVFPGRRTRKHKKKIDQAFARILEA